MCLVGHLFAKAPENSKQRRRREGRLCRANCFSAKENKEIGALHPGLSNTLYLFFHFIFTTFIFGPFLYYFPRIHEGRTKSRQRMSRKWTGEGQKKKNSALLKGRKGEGRLHVMNEDVGRGGNCRIDHFLHFFHFTTKTK